MFLNRKKYIWGKERAKVKVTGVEGVDNSKVNYITEEFLYWRKVHPLHEWFVNKVQEGEDDCGTYLVELDIIKDLIEEIELFIKNPKGDDSDFLGETDDYIVDELVRTYKELNEALLDKSKEDWDFEYHASW
jgi:hypothetical protein